MNNSNGEKLTDIEKSGFFLFTIPKLWRNSVL